jgi:hypothetical protein
LQDYVERAHRKLSPPGSRASLTLCHDAMVRARLARVMMSAG